MRTPTRSRWTLAWLSLTLMAGLLGATAQPIVVNGVPFDPSDGAPGPTEAGPGPQFWLVQLAGPTQDGWLEGLAAGGLDVLQYYPHHSYLVWGDAARTQSAVARAEVLSVVRFPIDLKPNQEVLARSGRIANVVVQFYDDGDVEGTLARLKELGAEVLLHHPAQPDRRLFDAVVRLDRDQIAAVSSIPTVLWLGFESPRPTLDDEMSSQIVAGNYTAGVPFVGYFPWLGSVGVDGTGVVWAVVDTGVDYDHPDLGPHIVGGYSFPGACNTNPGDDCAGGGHGTHVAGIIGGDATGGFTDGSGFLYGLGIAPAYGIFAMNSLSGASWPPAGGWQEHSKRAVLGGAIGGNNSWTTGEGTNHGYQASERTHDLMVRDGNFDTDSVAEPFIEVFSAGNSGPGGGTLTAPKEGKNLIVVASSLNFRVGNIDSISSFSSRGPAVDGRWVPTVAAPGSTIASSRNDLGGSCSSPIGGTNGLYAFCSGTSMAAPHVAGAVVLLSEWWRGQTEGGADPSPALAKALLVNSAVDMGTADIPNIHEGWGRIHPDTILSGDVAFAIHDQDELFTTSGQSLELNVTVLDPGEPLKVTIAWSDAPGSVGANPALVNDLDLTVLTGGNTYRGNVFSGGWSTTGGSADRLNNLENVYVQNPGGEAAILIDAFNIAGDGVPYNGDITDQDFAIVCQNCSEAMFTDGFETGDTSRWDQTVP